MSQNEKLKEQAKLLNEGTQHYNNGKIGAAIESFEQALSVDPSNPYPPALSNLGLCYHQKKEYEKAVGYFEQAIEEKQKKNGPDDVSLLVTLNNLIEALEGQGKTQEAEAIQQRCLKIQIQATGEESPEVATLYYNMGVGQFSASHYERAIEYLEKALKIQLKLKGEHHPDVAPTFNSLGSCYNRIANPLKAIENFERALTIQSIHSPDTFATANLFSNLGTLYDGENDLQKAEEYYLESIKIRQTLGGKKNSNIALLYNNLGTIAETNNNFSKAIEYYSECLAIQVDILDDDDVDIADSYSNLGGALNSCGKYKEATQNLKKALKIYEAVYGDHLTVAECLNNLGTGYDGRKKYKKAIDCLERALQMKIELIGADHESTLRTKQNLENTTQRSKEEKNEE